MKLKFLQSKKGLLVAGLIFFLSLSVVYVINHRLLNDVKDKVIIKIEKQLQADIEIESIKLGGFNQIVLEKFRLAEPEHEPLLKAEEAVIYYKWFDLLFHSLQPVKSIHKLKLTAPEVNLIKKNKWNYEFLQRSQKTDDDSFFSFSIVIDQGQVNYTSPQWNKQVTNIQGEVGLGQVITADLNCSLSNLPQAEFEIDGQLANQEYRGEVNFSNLSLVRFKEEFGLKLSQKIAVDYQGQLAGKLKASGKLGELPNYYGDLKLTQGQVSYQQFEFKDIKAEVGINNYGIKLKELTANYRKSLLTAKGEVFNWKEPQLNFAYSIQDFALTNFNQYTDSNLQLAGQAQAEGKIRGSVTDPTLVGEIKSDQAYLNQEVVNDFSAQVHYKEDIINIKQVEFKYQEGQINGDGTVNLQNKLKYMISLNFSSLELARFSPLGSYDLRVKGLAQGEGIISGQGLNKKDLNVLGTVEVNQGSIVGYPFEKFTSNFWVNKGKVFLNQTELTSGASRWNLEGIMDLDGNLNLNLQAEEVKLSDLKSLHRLDKLAGRIDLNGGLRGSLARPQFDGEFAISSLNYNDFSLNQAEGKINYNQGVVKLQQASLPELNTEATGTIDFKAKTSEVVLETNSVQIKRILDRANIDFSASGSLTGQIKLNNILDSPLISGNVKVNKGVVFQQPIDQLQLDFDYQNQKMVVNNLQAVYQSSSLKAEGQVEKEEVDLNISGQQIRLRDIKPLTNWGEVNGKTNLQGRLYGEITDLKLAGRVTSKSLQFNQHDLGDLTTSIYYEKPKLYVKTAELKNGNNHYQFKGGLNFYQQKFDQFTIDILKGNLSYLDQFLKQELGLPHSLQGRVIVNGLIEQPKLNLDLEVDDIGKSGKLRMKGNYWHQKGIDLNLAAQQFKLNPLTNLISLTDFNKSIPQLAGEASWQGKLTGSLDNLNLDSQLKITKGKIGNLNYEQLSGRIKILEGEKLFLQQSLQNRGSEIMRASGIIPLNSQEQFDLNLNLNEGSLNLLSMAVKDLQGVHGRGEASLSLQGTWQNIDIQGQAEVVRAGFSHPAFDAKVEQLNGRLDFVGNKIIVKELSGNYGQGSIQLAGNIRLSGFLPEEYNLDVKGKKILFEHGSWAGLNDADLEIEGGFYNPLIKGEITAYDTMFKLPVSWPTPDQPPKIVPRFDLVIVPSRNVKVGNDNIDILVQQGQLELYTTEQGNIELTGDLSSSTGRFTYYNTEFELVEGSARFTKYSFVPQLDIRARTTLAGEDGEFKEIYFDLQGTGEDLEAEPWKISFSSNPPMSRKEIVNLLARQGGIGNLLERDYEQAVKNEVWRIIGQGIKTELLYKIERSFEKSLNLDQVQIKSLLSNELEIKIGKYIFEDFMLKFTKTFGIEEKYSYGFEYRFSEGIDNLQLNGKYDNEGNYKLGMEFTVPF